MTIQAHPEFENEFNRQLLTTRKTSTIPEPLANKAIKALDEIKTQADSDRFGASIRDFFKSHRLA